MAENSGFHSHAYSGYSMAGDTSTNNHFLNIYQSRGKLLEQSQIQVAMKSPKRELDKALDSIFKGFSFYSEPVEEREVQR